MCTTDDDSLASGAEDSAYLDEYLTGMATAASRAVQGRLLTAKDTAIVDDVFAGLASATTTVVKRSLERAKDSQKNKIAKLEAQKKAAESLLALREQEFEQLEGRLEVSKKNEQTLKKQLLDKETGATKTKNKSRTGRATSYKDVDTDNDKPIDLDTSTETVATKHAHGDSDSDDDNDFLGLSKLDKNLGSGHSDDNGF